MGDLAPRGSYPGKEALQREKEIRLSKPVSETPPEPEFKMYTPAETKRVGKLNVLNPVRKPLIQSFPYLTKVVYKNMTVKQYAELLMKTSGVPTEFYEPFLPYLLPYLDPAKKPDYSRLLVEAGQPCKKARVERDFILLESALKYAKENLEETKEIAKGKNREKDIKDAERVIQTIIDGRFPPNAAMIGEPLGESGIAENLDFDVNGNAIGVHEEDVNRMYLCDRWLELRYPEAHAKARLRWIDADAATRESQTKTKEQAASGLDKKKKELNEAIDTAIKDSGRTWESIPSLITRYVELSGTTKLAKKFGLLTYDAEADLKYAEMLIPILQKAADKNERAVIPPRPAYTRDEELAPFLRKKLLTAKAGRRHTKMNRKTRKNKKQHRNVVPSHRKRGGTARR